jgi:hypothetical protein
MITASLDAPATAGPDLRPDVAAADQLLRDVELDPPPASRRLACHWQRAADGRFVMAWEPEIALAPRL